MSAVDWLLNELQTKTADEFSKMYANNQDLIESIFLNARKIEKEQLDKAIKETIIEISKKD